MPPTSLTKEQIDKLRELWEAGLTSVGDKRKIHAAVEATGLYEKTIKVINILLALSKFASLQSMYPKHFLLKNSQFLYCNYRILLYL